MAGDTGTAGADADAAPRSFITIADIYTCW